MDEDFKPLFESLEHRILVAYTLMQQTPLVNAGVDRRYSQVLQTISIELPELVSVASDAKREGQMGAPFPKPSPMSTDLPTLVESLEHDWNAATGRLMSVGRWPPPVLHSIGPWPPRTGMFDTPAATDSAAEDIEAMRPPSVGKWPPDGRA